MRPAVTEEKQAALSKESMLNAHAWISPVLAYHEISRNESPYFYSTRADVFEDHLQFVSSHSSPAPQVTFDDGHTSNYHNALALLDQHGVRATFFVSVGLVGNSPEFMEWPEVKELVSHGHDVQSHGYSHTLLTECSPKKLHEELRSSRQELEDRLGFSVSSLSLPGGRWNSRVLAACSELGYGRVYHSCPWAPKRITKYGVELVGRVMVNRRLEVHRLKNLLEIKGTAAFIERAKDHSKEVARFFLGNTAYIRLWQILAQKRSAQVSGISRAPGPMAGSARSNGNCNSN